MKIRASFYLGFRIADFGFKAEHERKRGTIVKQEKYLTQSALRAEGKYRKMGPKKEFSYSC
jgi:hypothetical protein